MIFRLHANISDFVASTEADGTDIAHTALKTMPYVAAIGPDLSIVSYEKS